MMYRNSDRPRDNTPGAESWHVSLALWIGWAVALACLVLLGVAFGA